MRQEGKKARKVGRREAQRFKKLSAGLLSGKLGV